MSFEQRVLFVYKCTSPYLYCVNGNGFLVSLHVTIADSKGDDWDPV